MLWHRDDVLRPETDVTSVSADVDHELVFLLQSIDERRSLLAADNAASAGLGAIVADSERKFAINGRLFGSLAGLAHIRHGDRGASFADRADLRAVQTDKRRRVDQCASMWRR